jgi:uncharacterized phage protein (TIGR01671 family)
LFGNLHASPALERTHGEEFDESIVLMQSTGLSDRNGVEIYEGDILGIPDSDDDTLCSVVFERGAFCKLYEADDQITGAFNSAFDEPDDDLWTIIGNVHQNPELLSA